MDKSILDILFNNPLGEKLKELFNLVLILADRISFLLKDIVLWIWDIFSRVFGVVLQFTIDLVNLVLSYF
ncbi:MAG: hypothetical protein AAB504_02220 [Patescibacteria group bacterium]